MCRNFFLAGINEAWVGVGRVLCCGAVAGNNTFSISNLPKKARVPRKFYEELLSVCEIMKQ